MKHVKLRGLKNYYYEHAKRRKSQININNGLTDYVVVNACFFQWPFCIFLAQWNKTSCYCLPFSC